MVVKVRKEVERVLENVDKIRSRTLRNLVMLRLLSAGFHTKWMLQYGGNKKKDMQRDDRRKKTYTNTGQIEKWLGCNRRTAHDYQLALESLNNVSNISDATFEAMVRALAHIQVDGNRYDPEDEATDADDLIDPLVIPIAQKIWRYLEQMEKASEQETKSQEKNTEEVQT